MSALAAALLSELDDGALDALARALAPRLASLIGGQTEHAEPWLTVEQASKHLACPKSRLYALVSARRVPFCKDGSRVLFRASELDEWLAKGGGRRP
jgi:excisionase family DNA binding protein